MPLSIRLDPALEAELRSRLARERRSLSAFLREAIREKLDRESQTPYELGKHLFGRYASGDRDRSARRKELIREKWQLQSPG